jgi:hypothetical protein
MDRFFKTTTRFRDLWVLNEENEHYMCPHVTEEALVGTLQDFSSHGFSFWDLVKESSQRQIVWITPHAYVRNFRRNASGTCWKDHCYEFVELSAGSFSSNPGYRDPTEGPGYRDPTESLVVFAGSFKEMTSACNDLFSLLASSNVAELYVYGGYSRSLGFPVSARTLSNFVKESHKLEHVQFDEVTLDGQHMSAFAAAPPNLLLYLEHCVLTAAAKEVLKTDARLLRIKIFFYCCNSDTGVLADVLDGKNKSIIKSYTLKSTEDRELDACLHALEHDQNQGLVQFSFGFYPLRIDELIELLDSLKTHPALVKLDLFGSTNNLGFLEGVDYIKLMMAIVDMLQVNTVIQEIILGCVEDPQVHNEMVLPAWRIHDEMVLPLLEANATRAHVRALADVEANATRASVRALADAWHEAATDNGTTKADGSL